MIFSLFFSFLFCLETQWGLGGVEEAGGGRDTHSRGGLSSSREFCASQSCLSRLLGLAVPRCEKAKYLLYGKFHQ